MQSIAETCVRFDAAHSSINLVSEIAVPMFPTLKQEVVGDFCFACNYCTQGVIENKPADVTKNINTELKEVLPSNA